MNRYAQATLLSALVCMPAMAQERAALDPQVMDVGRGVICDTLEQANQYAYLRGDGKEVRDALQLVNDEAHKKTACNYALVRFSSTKPLSALIIRGKALSILEITVHAFSNGSTWTEVPAMVQYTVVAEKGIAI